MTEFDARRAHRSPLGRVPPNVARRDFIAGALAMTATAMIPARIALAQGGSTSGLAPTPECAPGRSTPSQTEGPFYTPRTPLKVDFRKDASGEPIVLEGHVLDTRCRPLAGAWLDFWHADPEGAYDNSGFRLRGHQIADAQGRYRLDTLLPALYVGRTRHIHVKVRAREGGRILTTQTYFPGEPGNARDGLYRPELVARRAGNALLMDYVIQA